MSSKNVPTAPDEIVGTVIGHRDGHGFVQADDGQADLYLSPNEMRAVLHRDRVSVRIVRWDRKGRPEAKVLDIIERPTQPIIGRLLQESGVYLVAPEDKRYGRDVLIPPAGMHTSDLGKVVAVELTEKPSLFAQPIGRVTEVLGDIDDPGMEIEIAVRKYGVPHEFSEAALAQTKALPEELGTIDGTDRVDLTDIPLVTIDGEDARDFDDAVYCEPHQIGRGKNAQKGWRLLVAIADVSHYVTDGSALDRDAYERATSVYFPRRVLPMLPEKLSNGLCSLKPQVDRLCMVCDMVIDSKGQRVAYQFYPAVMHSQARLTYTEVAAILANTRGPEATHHHALLPHLLHLHDVYRALLQARQARGAVDLETVETQIVCDESGRVQKIVPRVRNDAHRLIEESMLIANVCAADFIHHGVPGLRGKAAQQFGLYRVHEGPTPEKRETLKQFLKTTGLHLSVSDNPQPAEFQAIAHATQDRADAQQIHTMLLRSMQQAIYSPHNSGHFGLAFEAYTHFTSPIRRYPDLMVHRVIKSLLRGQAYKLPELPAAGAESVKLARQLKRLAARQAAAVQTASPEKARALAVASPSNPSQQEQLERWEIAGLQCSANERRADEASRDVDAWLKCHYMRQHLGEEYTGVVTAVTSFGLFVMLEGLYVEGLVHITELGGEYYRHDEVRQELCGERTGMRYALGSKLHVQVSRVDLDSRKIDFRLVRSDAPLHGTPSSGPGPHVQRAQAPGKSKKGQTAASTGSVKATRKTASIKNGISANAKAKKAHKGR